MRVRTYVRTYLLPPLSCTPQRAPYPVQLLRAAGPIVGHPATVQAYETGQPARSEKLFNLNYVVACIMHRGNVHTKNAHEFLQAYTNTPNQKQTYIMNFSLASYR